MKPRHFLVSVVVACTCASLAEAAGVAGPSSSQTPYLEATAGAPPITIYSIWTSGDVIGGYKAVGVPDGIGSYSNGDGTMTVLVNHELGAASGVVRAHGGTGTFVSRWVVNTTPGADFLKVLSGRDLDDSVQTTTAGAGTLNSFARFCSADLAPPTAFYNAATGFGTQKRIYLNGEENGGTSRAMAHVIDVNGANTGVGIQLADFDGLNAAWENLLAHPNLGNKTLVMGNSDGGDNRVFAYLGQKTNTGSDIQKAGLVGGSAYGVQVTVNGNDIVSENRQFALASSGAAVTSGRFTLTPGRSGTSFQRPEDGAWDPSRPNDYYFVTTDQVDQVKDGVGTQIGRTRLWRMTYDDVNNPTAGGKIDALLDGTEPIQMLDNITVVPGVDGHTRILAVEDVGGNAHNGKLWMYDTATDALTLVGKHFANNGDIGVGATAPFNQDEEFSGVVDARDTLGLGWFLVDDQQHYAVTGEQVEGGQLMAFYLPAAVGVPEPTTLGALVGLSLAVLQRRRASH